MKEKLLSAGYKIWGKEGKQRIYINDITKYFTVEKLSGGRFMANINGIDISNYNSNVRHDIMQIVTGAEDIKIYYDCDDQMFYFTNHVIAAKNIIETAIEKIKSL